MNARAVVGPVLCCCSWTGSLPVRASCPACGRSHHDRVTPERLAVLRAIKAIPRASILPIMRIRLREMRLIEPVEPPRAGGGDGRRRPANRAHRVTVDGDRVLAAARIVEQTRHDVAAAVARHAIASDS